MIKRMILMLLLALIVLGGIFGWKAYSGIMMGKKMAQNSGPPPQAVATIVAAMSDWENRLEAIGTVRAVNGVDIASEVSGTVAAIPFESGQSVDKGSVLLRLDDSDDAARLKALEATAQLAAITLDRDQKQLAAKAISQAAVDAAEAGLAAARAEANAQRAVVAKKTIRAPFAGELGLRHVDVGQYLNPGTMIVSLQQMDPVYIDFYLPQKDAPSVKAGQKVIATADAWPDKSFVGEIMAVDSRFDESTRTALVRASIPNPERLLRPGMFTTVSVVVGAATPFITLPQTAIGYDAYGTSVYRVEPATLPQEPAKDGEGKDDAAKSAPTPRTVKQAFVKLGAQRGDQIAILDGVKEGDEIVSAGQFKLFNGAPVIVNNSVQPSNDAAPKPEDF